MHICICVCNTLCVPCPSLLSTHSFAHPLARLVCQYVPPAYCDISNISTVNQHLIYFIDINGVKIAIGLKEPFPRRNIGFAQHTFSKRFKV